MTGDRLLTPYEAARLLGVDPSTLRRYVAAGRLVAVRTPGGHHRYPSSTIRRLLAGRGAR